MGDLFKINNLNVLDYEHCKLVAHGQKFITNYKKMETEYWYDYFKTHIKEWCSEKGNNSPIVNQEEFFDKHNIPRLHKEYVDKNTLSLLLENEFKEYYIEALSQINKETENPFPFYLYSMNDKYDNLFIPFVDIDCNSFCELLELDKSKMTHIYIIEYLRTI